ncbi:GGDEF domain-containing protein, partial [Candidatus Peregrinibacteria bacterium]|nr:GGDEF domain-containing protein [Candidatus Peregrinibacteria bacterium]
MDHNLTPRPPQIEGEGSLKNIYHHASRYISPLINQYCAVIKLDPEHRLNRLFFFEGGLTLLGKKILKAAYTLTLERLAAEFTTNQAMEEVFANDTTIKVISLLVEANIEIVANQEIERERSGYDNLMKGFIQKNNTSGLYARVIQQILQNSRETGRPLSLVFLDLDNFKGVNNYGQQVGDATLTHLAEVIKANMRDKTTCIRWGGEEIVLLFEDCDELDACETGIRINQALNENPLYLLANVKDHNKQEVGTFSQLDELRYQELLPLAISQQQRRATETTIIDPRNPELERKVRLLKIPLSASIGVVAVNANDPAAID